MSLKKIITLANRVDKHSLKAKEALVKGQYTKARKHFVEAHRANGFMRGEGMATDNSATWQHLDRAEESVKSLDRTFNNAVNVPQGYKHNILPRFWDNPNKKVIEWDD